MDKFQKEVILRTTAISLARKGQKGRPEARHLDIVFDNFCDVFDSWVEFLMQVAGKAPNTTMKKKALELLRK